MGVLITFVLYWLVLPSNKGSRAPAEAGPPNATRKGWNVSYLVWGNCYLTCLVSSNRAHQNTPVTVDGPNTISSIKVL